MFFLNKLKKWIEIEIKELKVLQEKYEVRNQKERMLACKEQIQAYYNILYIINSKGVWLSNRGHDIFRNKGRK